MKHTKSLVLALLVALTAVTASAGDCLSVYNHDLITCDATMGGATRWGCKTDALIDYYGCLADAATS